MKKNPSSSSSSSSARPHHRSSSTIAGAAGAQLSSPSPPPSSSLLPTTTTKTTPCCTKVGLKRGPWTPEEDQFLSNYIKREGEGKWRTLPKKAGLLRCGKSCRLRWMNYLRPNVKRGHIAPDEEDLILRLHRLLGNRWSLIAGRIPGRTDNEIKNYWNTHLSKKLISQGIDPRTHKPLLMEPNHHSMASSSSSLSKTSHDHHHPNLITNNNTTFAPINSSPFIMEDQDAALILGAGNSIHDGHDDQFVLSTAETMTDYGIGNEMNNIIMRNNYAAAADDDDDDDRVYGMMNTDDREGLRNEDHQDHEDIINNYCSSTGTDDIFSSFLNSLITTEDVIFNSHNNQLQLVHHDHHQEHDALISSTPLFAFAPGSWEAPVINSTSTASASSPPSK